MPIETKIETMPGLFRPPEGSASPFPLVGVAEDAGFEPARACTQHAFQIRKPRSRPIRTSPFTLAKRPVERSRTPTNGDN